MADEDTDLEMSDREILTSTVDLQQGHHHISAKEYVKIHIKSIVMIFITFLITLAYLISGVCGILLITQVGIYMIFIQAFTNFLCIILSISITITVAVTIDGIKKENDYLDARFQNVTLHNGIVMFVGFLMINMSLMLLIWGYTIGEFTYIWKFYHAYTAFKLITGLINPLIFCTGVVIVLTVMQRLTNYEFQAESVLTGFLTFVSFDIGDEKCFWVLTDFYYFAVNKHTSKKWYCTSLSTVIITIILFLNIMLPILFIIDSLFIQRYTSENCRDIDEAHNCFLRNTKEYFNCSNNSSYVGDIECINFIRLEDITSVDFLGSSIRAVFLFLATEKIMNIILDVLKMLLLLYESRMWIVFELIMGGLMVIISLAAIVIYYVDFESNFTFLSVLEFSIISADVVLIGLLLLLASPMKLVSAPVQKEIIVRKFFLRSTKSTIKEKLKKII